MKKKGGINTPLETPVTPIYMVTDLLKICQTAFNHGAVGRPASREQRSKISSGDKSPESLWSLALSDFNLLHHQARIHCEGQMRIFLSQTSATKQPERHYIFTKWFTQLKNHSLTWWCQHLHSMNHTCLSDSDQCLGALECNVSFENNVPWVSQLVRSLAFAQGVWNVNSTQP